MRKFKVFPKIISKFHVNISKIQASARSNLKKNSKRSKNRKYKITEIANKSTTGQIANLTC